MGWVIFIIAVIAILVIATISESNDVKNRDVEFSDKLQQDKEFNATTLIKGYNNHYFFAIDKGKSKVMYMANDAKRVLSFEQIISVELEEDSHIISTKSTARTLGGGLIGGAVAGGAGMIVGGLSGGSREKKKVSFVNVRIRVRDIDNPTLKIACFNARSMNKESSSPTSGWQSLSYQECFSHATQIVDLIIVIIDQVDAEAKKNNSTPQQTSSSSADEIMKLVKLKEMGAITEAEFEQQKKALLS